MVASPGSTDDTEAIGQDAVDRIKQAAAKNPVNIALLGVTDPIVDRSFKLNKDLLTVGRSPFNDIIIKASSVSAHHAEIEKIDDQWLVRDLGSSNGSFVNDCLIDECVLYSDDSLFFGEVELIFDSGGANPAPPDRVIDSLDSAVAGGVPKLWLGLAATVIVIAAAILLLL
ncbi:FHA domain-containing protein [Oceanicoccus sp. KOV_DT_Chl]|uniref:FHA domain-containing protein n=1 Tax=Oceanicoccus sp. KOV_DT_Chl TaxID=1904639 RepID=UPI000C7ABEA5|nr:FHA domain-containing protein [Oceanicoccus sp. KOV_DT_Chl]